MILKIGMMTPVMTAMSVEITATRPVARDGDDERDERAREEAGADWMVEQGFDRKD